MRVPVEIAEPSGEVVVARLIGQAGLPGKQAGEHGPDCIGVCQHPAQEVENEDNIRLRCCVGLTGAGDGFAQKHPQRFRQVEFRPLRALVPPDAALLVEGQQQPSKYILLLASSIPLRRLEMA